MTPIQYRHRLVKARIGWVVVTHRGVDGVMWIFITWHWALRRDRAQDKAVRYAAKRHLLFGFSEKDDDHG